MWNDTLRSTAVLAGSIHTKGPSRLEKTFKTILK